MRKRLFISTASTGSAAAFLFKLLMKHYCTPAAAASEETERRRDSLERGREREDRELPPSCSQAHQGSPGTTGTQSCSWLLSACCHRSHVLPAAHLSLPSHAMRKHKDSAHALTSSIRAYAQEVPDAKCHPYIYGRFIERGEFDSAVGEETWGFRYRCLLRLQPSPPPQPMPQSCLLLLSVYRRATRRREERERRFQCLSLFLFLFTDRDMSDRSDIAHDAISCLSFAFHARLLLRRSPHRPPCPVSSVSCLMMD